MRESLSDIAYSLAYVKTPLLHGVSIEELDPYYALVGQLRRLFFVDPDDDNIQETLSRVHRCLQTVMRPFAGGQAHLDESVANILQTLPEMKAHLWRDVEAGFAGDPSARSTEEVIESFPSVTALIHHRMAHEIYKCGWYRVARRLSEIGHTATGIDIHPGASLGPGFFVDHGTGVVIGETAIVGSGVRLYQGVTLGAKSFQRHADGSLVKGEARHPIVEDGVVIYAHATILGRVRIGEGAVIGGNVWVTSDVPSKTHVTQTTPKREIFGQAGGGI